jgi:cell fate (sporulation/competence/biofilm development) regulator YmcA (YheA/YmcA/DUF963 family)
MEVDGAKFQPNAEVLVEKNQTIKKKVSLVKKGYKECVPHLVSECPFLD